MARGRHLLGLGIPAAALMVLMSMGAPLAQGQEAEDVPHPAHIHSGTCDDLGESSLPLVTSPKTLPENPSAPKRRCWSKRA